MSDSDLISLTADIVSAHVSNNNIPSSDIPALIRAVHDAFTTLGEDTKTAPQELKPAVAIRSSVKPDYIVCLEDGKRLQMLKRYLRTNFDMTPDEYRKKWGLPRDYPMVAPGYADQRREMAKRIGLGRKATEPAPVKAKAAKASAPTKASTVQQTKKATVNAAPAPIATEAPPARRRGRPKKVTQS